MLLHRTNHSELRSVILSQDVKTIERLLDQGADVDNADPVGITSLHIASTKNFANIVQILISHGASVNRRSHERTNCYTPLHHAVEGGHEEIVKILLSNKADVHLCTKAGMSPLDIAVERKYVDITRVLLSHGASVNSPSSPTYLPAHGLWENYQPLHRAVESGHDELVKMLLDSGADVNADAVSITDIHSGVRRRLANEWTPLHIAAEKGYISITKTLLEHGANVNAGKYGQLISPLCVAMKEASSISELLRYLKDPENKKLEIGDTKYEIITNLLLEHGAVFVPELDVFQAGLHGAVTMGNTTTVEYILKSFPDAIDSFRNVRERNCTLLHTAAKFSNVKSVEFLIRHGADVNAEDNCGQTPIFYVVNEKDEILMDDPKIRGDDLRTAELLLSNGANVDCRDKNMQTLLHHAVENDNYEMVNFLLMHNACVESHIESVMSPLHVAVDRKNAQIAEVLLNNGARINSVCFESCVSSSSNLDGPDSDTGSQGSLDHCPSTSNVLNCPSDREPLVFGFNSQSATPLDCAVREGREEFVKLLLSKMISADANSANNSTPLCSAINSGYHRIVQLLLEHGFYINVDDKEIKEALFTTVGCGYVKTLKYIFKTRPDVNMIVDNKGRTLWHHAVMYSGLHTMNGVTATEVAKLLIKHGCDLNALDDGGKTPLLHALESIMFYTDNILDMVKYLLEHGARVDPTDENLQTMIRRFIEFECCTLIELLLKYCSDIKVLLHANGTPLLCTAIEFGCTEVVRLLIKYGADVNVTNESGKNPLHLATREAPETVEMLIESGADVDRRDEDGETALHIAASPGCGESSRVMTVLLKYRADVNITSNDNFTALDHALKRFPRDDKTRILLTKHLIKMKAANLFVSQQNLQSIGSCDSYKDFYDTCKVECEKMKKTKVADTNVRFYDVLTGIHYARNESVVKSLESCDYETEFPLYYDWLMNNFKRAQKRISLLTQSAIFLNSSLGHELPEIVTMKILSYLADCDLQNLIETYSNDTSLKLYEMETNGKITIIKKDSG